MDRPFAARDSFLALLLYIDIPARVGDEVESHTNDSKMFGYVVEFAFAVRIDFFETVSLTAGEIGEAGETRPFASLTLVLTSWLCERRGKVNSRLDSALALSTG